VSQLAVSDLKKYYQTSDENVEVLRGISFQIQSGENLVITGPSGSGKSTLLHILGSLDQPTSGSIVIDDRDPFSLPEPELARFRNQFVGFVFQDHHLLPQYSVLENVLLPAVATSSGEDKKARALELLEQVQLSHRLRHRPAEISGGERQRVAVARALINQPKLMLCDEPTGNLDAKTAEAVGSLLMELHQKEQNILIGVTHSLELAGLFGRRFELQEGLCCEV
jgi:lipoprotein-releasing system ATP-binding protein